MLQRLPHSLNMRVTGRLLTLWTVAIAFAAQPTITSRADVLTVPILHAEGYAGPANAVTEIGSCSFQYHLTCTDTSSCWNEPDKSGIPIVASTVSTI